LEEKGKVKGGRNELSILRLSGENAGESVASPSSEKRGRLICLRVT
jgi:hypothetical protein